LIQDLKETPLNPNHKFASLHISNMYSNTRITIAETRNILNSKMKSNLLDPPNKTRTVNLVRQDHKTKLLH